MGMDEEKNGLPGDKRLADELKEFDLKQELFDWAESLVAALVIIVLLFAFFVRLIGVDGESMEQTLHDRDYVIVSHLFYEPEAGDIVVLTKRTFMEDSIVKRVIATEGQTVDIDFETGTVSVDNVILDESYTNTPTNRRGDVQFPVTVPPGSVFVMGDNRNYSTDSRVSAVGMVDTRYIVGHVLLRVFPFTKLGPVDRQ